MRDGMDALEASTRERLHSSLVALSHMRERVMMSQIAVEHSLDLLKQPSFDIRTGRVVWPEAVKRASR